jgi:predicted nucleic acid-binding protein
VIVVADTSVILNLCFLGHEALLPVLFGTVHAPPEVEAEFMRLAAADIRFMGLAFPSFILRTAPKTTTHAWAQSPVLHGGEIAALSLALELRADLVLMDESRLHRAESDYNGTAGHTDPSPQTVADSLGGATSGSSGAGSAILDGSITARQHPSAGR